MSKLIIEFDPDIGTAFSDNQSKPYVNNVIDNKDTVSHVTIGTGHLLDLFRCAVVEKKIKHTEMEFLFKGEIIPVDRYGTCKNWPKGFGDASMDALEILLGYQYKDGMRKHKQKLN